MEPCHENVLKIIATLLRVRWIDDVLYVGSVGLKDFLTTTGGPDSCQVNEECFWRGGPVSTH